MLRPSYDELIEKISETSTEENVDSKYSIVIAVAKRAREIIEQNESVNQRVIKPVSASIKDIYAKRTIISKKQELKSE